ELEKAIQFDNVVEVEKFLKRGLDVNATNEDGFRLIELAIHTRKTFEFLVAQGADVKAPTKIGNYGYLLHLIATQGNQYGPSIEKAKLLVAKGADVTSRNSYGETPLHIAASREYGVPMAKFLLSKGADINAIDHNAESPVHWAAGLGCFDCVVFLHANGAQIDLKNNKGDTPLLKVVKSGRINMGPILEFLIKNGADTSVKDMNGLTPLQLVEGKAHRADLAIVLQKYQSQH
ncbi:MAG: ankyrin repeat domain-containing protein, partial [Sulfuricaulis sp.]|uniref:ankyrin repeat domain-containing protein n=1 Tax=Sulfuricaulis sp. TaxID=2003553 RepID=UPI003C5E8F43